MAIDINLSKGVTINLEKEVPTLKSVRVTLKWNTLEEPKIEADADLSIVNLGQSGEDRKIYGGTADWVIFYNTPDTKLPNGDIAKTSPNGSIRHWGDNRNGGFHNGVDGEQVDIDLDKLPEDLVEVAILGTIHEGKARNQNWNALGAVLELENIETGETFAQYVLERDFPTQTAIHVGSFKRTGPQKWEFEAVGAGSNEGLGFYINYWS